ncbi:Protein of unknown function [Bacillus toyonensis]|nr:Protein of unknown function [Bacillus toyonensis]
MLALQDSLITIVKE